MTASPLPPRSPPAPPALLLACAWAATSAQILRQPRCHASPRITPNSCLSAGALHHVEPALLTDSSATSLASRGCLPGLRPPANGPAHLHSLSLPPPSLRNPTYFAGSDSPMKSSKTASHPAKTHKNTHITHILHTHTPRPAPPHTHTTHHTHILTSHPPHTYHTHNIIYTKDTHSTPTPPQPTQAYTILHMHVCTHTHLPTHTPRHQLPIVCSCPVLLQLRYWSPHLASCYGYLYFLPPFSYLVHRGRFYVWLIFVPQNKSASQAQWPQWTLGELNWIW